MKRHIFSALAAVAALALASCSMFNDVEKPAESTGSYLKIGATAARTALPSVENVTDFTSFTLTGTASGEAASVNTSWTGDDSATAYARMTAASVAVTKDATYAFTLSAVKGGATWSGTATKTIAAGANSLSFTLSLSSLEDQGSGSISITLTVPESVQASDAVLKSMDESETVTVDGTPLSFAGSRAAYTADDIPAGSYVLVFTLWGDSAKTLKIADWREYVGVAADLTSASSPVLVEEDLDGIYTLTLNSNGGTISAGITVPGSFTRSSAAITLPAAASLTKTGCTFEGWFDNESLSGEAVTTVPAGSTGNKEFWAKWSNPVATITATPTVTAGDIMAVTETELVSAGTVEGGTLMYAVTTENTKPTSTEGFSATVPTAESITEPGTYYVWYYVKADDTHTDSEISATAIAVTVRANPKAVPLTLEALTAGTIVVSSPKSGMQYSKNGGDKTAMTETTTIDVAEGDTVAFYGNGTSITSYYGTKITGGTAGVKVYGNIMSLVDETGFATATALAGQAFCGLFSGNEMLKDASDLLLPATTLAAGCYQDMFCGCTSLTAAPALPATTLAYGCYYHMFDGCRSLTEAPALPATMLADSCYYYMFYGCTSLTTAPELPATTLAQSCYSGMFFDCTSLTEAPELPATTLADYCYSRMFADCTRLTTAPELPATTLAASCYCYMFYGCTSLTEAPELPATTLTNYCYQYMFCGCSSLKAVTCLATDVSAEDCTSYWLQDAGSSVTGLKTFTTPSGTNWSSGDSGIPSGWTRLIPDGSESVSLSTPLTLKTLSAGTIVVESPKSGMQYSKNGGDKTAMTEEDATIDVAAGDTVSFYGNGTSITSYDGTRIYDGTAVVKVYGNIMSLVDEEGFATATALVENAFSDLFDGNTMLKDASGLLLPATTLADSCYCYMFYGCTSLTTAPELPATTLADSCYCYMFSGCTSLTEAPELPAETLANYCYGSMFFGCTSLTTAPALPATTLADSCYYYMFYGCTSLTEAPALPAETLADYCYGSMFYDCTSLTEAPETLPATTLAKECYQKMFSCCTSLTEAPALPATTLAENCYYYMFDGCTSLTEAPALPATSLALNCYAYMFENCSSLTEAPALPATTLAESCYQYMFQNCTSLTTAPELPATTLAENCYYRMFYGCTSLSAVTCLATDVSASNCTYQWLVNAGSSVTGTKTFTTPSTTSWDSGTNGIPEGWTRLNPDGSEYVSLSTPLTLKALSDGTIVVEDPKNGMQYSKNGGDKAAMTTTTTIDVAAGDTVSFYGNGTSITSYSGTCIYDGTAQVKVYGNIMSLVDETGFATATTLSAEAFRKLFSGNKMLKDASGLLLPATTLDDNCYDRMFYGCRSLTEAPELPATTLAYSCYCFMFYGCTSLTEAPELPATTLAGYCYDNMFCGCTSLTTAPELPATTLAYGCYYCMFDGCTSLSAVTCLATDVSADYCTYQWLRDAGSSVTGTKTFTTPSTTSWSSGDSGIPEGWTRVDSN